MGDFGTVAHTFTDKIEVLERYKKIFLLFFLFKIVETSFWSPSYQTYHIKNNSKLNLPFLNNSCLSLGRRGVAFLLWWMQSPAVHAQQWGVYIGGGVERGGVASIWLLNSRLNRGSIVAHLPLPLSSSFMGGLKEATTTPPKNTPPNLKKT